HSRLDNLKVQGVPLEKLKSLANHSDISTTESYLKDRSEEDIAEIF
ncbi:site-specific integrase, partial [Bacillus cereus]|nr:site-specific integrase [Bacillus cereus]